MADNSSEFTEAEKKRLEILNKQFSVRQKQLKQIKRRNIGIFACLLTSVAGICILFDSNDALSTALVWYKSYTTKNNFRCKFFNNL